MEVEYDQQMPTSMIKCLTLQKEACRGNRMTFYTQRIIKDAIKIWEFDDMDMLDAGEIENYLYLMRHIFSEDEYQILTDLMDDEA